MPSRRSVRIVERDTAPKPAIATALAPVVAKRDTSITPRAARAKSMAEKKGPPTSVVPKEKEGKRGKPEKKEKRDKKVAALLGAVERLEDALADERARVHLLTGQAKKLAAKVDELEMVKLQYAELKLSLIHI